MNEQIIFNEFDKWAEERFPKFRIMTPDVDDDRIIRPNIDDWTNENPEPSTEYQDTVWVIIMSVIAIFLLALFGASLKKQQNRSKDTEYNVFKLREKRKDASTTEGDEKSGEEEGKSDDANEEEEEGKEEE